MTQDGVLHPQPVFTKRAFGLGLAICAIILTIATTHRAAAEGRPGTSAWSLAITPYFWGAGRAGRVAPVPGMPPVQFESGLGNAIDNLDLGGMLTLSASTGRFGLSGDLQFINPTNSSSSVSPAHNRASIDSENTIATLMGEVLLNDSKMSQFWAGAGMRYWSVKTDLSLTAGTSPAQVGEGSDSWFDPVVGVRGRAKLSESTFLTGWAYTGGFGVGSEEMIDLFGGLGYRFTEHVSGIAGYRWLSADRIDGPVVYDTEQQGMLAGITFNF